jgi:hypothetical protein
VITRTAVQVERTVAASRILSTRPPAVCPTHRCKLTGGDIQYRCPEGHRVQAADISREVSR